MAAFTKHLLCIALLLIINHSANAAPIDTTEYVFINGIKQYISIKGADRTKPILLFLHGGPGRSLIGPDKVFTDKLVEKFVVVQWDQRETGKTLERNKTPDKITIAQLKEDANLMVVYLLEHFEQPKLYLASHSWGSVMGFDVARKQPERLYAYIPISPMLDAVRSAELTVDSMRKWAANTKNDTAISELAKVHVPYSSDADIFYAQKWLFIHNGVAEANTPQFKTTFSAWTAIWYNVWKQNAKTSIVKTIKELECPVYFIAGIGDMQTPYEIVYEYHYMLQAPKKKLYTLAYSGHTIFNTQPDKLQEIFIKEVLPETYF